jgi:hypothetical protein
VEITEVAQLISHGGVVALALVVWYELRIHRAELKSTRDVIANIGNTLAKILERDRDREVREFIREEISGVHEAPALASELAEAARGRPAGDDDDDTPVDSPRGEYRQVKKRARTDPGGPGPRDARERTPQRVQIPRKPTPHPTRRDSDDEGEGG